MKKIILILLSLVTLTGCAELKLTESMRNANRYCVYCKGVCKFNNGRYYMSKTPYKK